MSLPSLEAEPGLLSVVLYISTQSGGIPSSTFCGVLLSLPILEADPRSSRFCGVLSLPSLEAEPHLLSVVFFCLYSVWRWTLVSFLWCSTISTQTGGRPSSPFCGVLLPLPSLEAEPRLLSVVFYYLYPDWKRTLISFLWCSTISTQTGGRPSSPFCGVLLSLPILEANPRSSPFCGVLSLPSLEAEPHLLSVVFYYLYPVWRRTLVSFLWCSTISTQSGGGASSPFCGVLLSLPSLETDPRSSPFCVVILSLPSLLMLQKKDLGEEELIFFHVSGVHCFVLNCYLSI